MWNSAYTPLCIYILIRTQHTRSGTLEDVLDDPHLTLEYDTMLQMLIDIAAGMAYFHGQKTPLIHEALTPATVMVDANYRVCMSVRPYVYRSVCACAWLYVCGYVHCS